MPTRMRDLTNTDFGTLNVQKNKNVMRYNASTGKFDVIDIDTILGLTTSLPQTFIDAVESELNVSNIVFSNIDGGTF